MGERRTKPNHLNISERRRCLIEGRPGTTGGTGWSRVGELLGKLSSVVSIRKGRAGHCAPSWHISTSPTDERGSGDQGPRMLLVVESSQKHGGFGWVVLELPEPRAHAACTFLLALLPPSGCRSPAHGRPGSDSPLSHGAARSGASAPPAQ